MPDASYHRRQAETLIRLALSSTDQETARQLMLLAAEHTALADADEVGLPEGRVVPGDELMEPEPKTRE